jgi:hypothetical protein
VVQHAIEAQVSDARRVRQTEKLESSVRSSKALAADAVFLVGGLGYTLPALLVPRYRRRLSRLRTEQKGRKAELANQRVAARLEALGTEMVDEVRAVMELQRDADVMREACLRLGAAETEVPNQAVRVVSSSNNAVQVSVIP